jgi:hypothetical protein
VNRNPITASYGVRIAYAVAWVPIALVHALVAGIVGELPPSLAALDAALFSLLMAVMLRRLWYPISYSRELMPTWRFSSLAMHAALYGILLACVGCYTVVLYFDFVEDVSEQWQHYLLKSLPWKAMEAGLLYVVAALTYYLYIYIKQLNAKAANEITLTKMLKDSELNLLKSQINPHFLFNSLNSLNALIPRDAEQSQEMLVALSDYLRYAVQATHRETATLREEVENVERYLAIEKLRFGEKLRYHIDADEGCMGCPIPAMLLMPLFENAVKHGVYESVETVNINATATRKAQQLHIEIRNDYDPDLATARKGAGSGLRNAGERLRLLYGDVASLQIQKNSGKFVVAINLPFAT